MSKSTTTSPFSKPELQELRERFPHTRQRQLYLNHAAVGPLSIDVVEAIQQRMKHRSSGRIDNFERDAAVAEATRKYLANLINAPAEDRIAFVTNTSEGINIVADGLEWREGDHILINDLEFPANVYPYKKLRDRGVDVQQIASQNGKITADRIEEHIRPSTRMVAISAVQFLNGYRADLEAIGELCRQHDCWFVVDAIQALGAISVDVQKYNIDALVSGSHKWLMGPQGIGFLYVTDELQQAIVHHHVGWLSVKEPWLFFETDQELDESARRYELGTPNANGLYGLNATLETYYEVGGGRIARQIRTLTDRLIETFRDWKQVTLATPPARDERAGIVTIHLPESMDCQHFQESLRDQHVTIALRENSLRLSPHYYNTIEEIDRALEVIGHTLQ